MASGLGHGHLDRILRATRRSLTSMAWIEFSLEFAVSAGGQFFRAEPCVTWSGDVFPFIWTARLQAYYGQNKDIRGLGVNVQGQRRPGVTIRARNRQAGWRGRCRGATICSIKRH